VVRFSRYARQVTLLVRGRDLGASMSQYLIDQLSGIPNVDVRVRTQVVSLEANDRLRALVVRSGDSAEPVRLPAAALFICIGGMPRTDGAAGIGLATNAAGYLVTGSDGAADRGARDLYDCGSRARRPPLLPRRHQALMRVLQPAASSVLMDACLAATGDLLNVAKALLSGWRHNLCVIAGQTASFRRILPLRMPLRGKRSWVLSSNSASDLGGAKRARTADLLHAMNHQHVHSRHHTLRQLHEH